MAHLRHALPCKPWACWQHGVRLLPVVALRARLTRAIHTHAPQIVLLGVCVGPSKPGGADAFETLSLQAMPLYAVPSDNVVMTCAAASPSTGR